MNNSIHLQRANPLLRELRSISFHLQIADHVSAQRAEHNLYSFTELKSIADHVQNVDSVSGQRAEENLYSVAE
jgi:hypothetical protein